MDEICQVLKGLRETRLWIKPVPQRLLSQRPTHFVTERRKVVWRKPIWEWGQGMLADTVSLLASGLVGAHIPDKEDIQIYEALLEHLSMPRLAEPWC
jgi:hypothetical protein